MCTSDLSSEFKNHLKDHYFDRKKNGDKEEALGAAVMCLQELEQFLVPFWNVFAAAAIKGESEDPVESGGEKKGEGDGEIVIFLPIPFSSLGTPPPLTSLIGFPMPCYIPGTFRTSPCPVIPLLAFVLPAFRDSDTRLAGRTREPVPFLVVSLCSS